MNEITNERFPNPLVYADYGKTESGVDRKILLKDFVWDDPLLGIIKVPSGFLFDGASIPKSAWTVMGLHPFSSEIIRAGLVHDYLYSVKVIGRKDADDVLHRILKYEDQLSSCKIFLIYSAVRVAGSEFYDNKQQKSDYYRPEEVKQFLENK